MQQSALTAKGIPSTMRTATIALLLCSLLLVHEAQAWVPIFPPWHWTVLTVARSLLGASGFQPWSWIIINSAYGENYNVMYQRYTRFLVYFRFRENVFPYRWFECRARMSWPKGPFYPNPETPVPSFWNKCWQI